MGRARPGRCPDRVRGCTRPRQGAGGRSRAHRHRPPRADHRHLPGHKLPADGAGCVARRRKAPPLPRRPAVVRLLRVLRQLDRGRARRRDRTSGRSRSGRRCPPIGAGAVTATPGLSVLFYYTTFDPDTGATEPTLGISPANRTIARGGTITFTVTLVQRRRPPLRGRRRLGERGGIATRANSTGHLTVQFTHTGTFPVRATLAGAIRSRTVWVRVTRPALVLTAVAVAACGSSLANAAERAAGPRPSRSPAGSGSGRSPLPGPRPASRR